jgi:hypothetical protein
MSRECRNDCLEELLFPRAIRNRPGLSRIDYRIGTYSDILEALLRQLNNDPLLAGWTHREADDPGIALLEGAAIVGDILAFYQDLYANEAYLRTAQWGESIADLVRLTGYLLSPGVGGRATFAVEVKDENNQNKPVTIPKSMPIKAQVTGLEQAADFETTQSITAYPALGKFNLYRRLYTPKITSATKEFYIFSPDQNMTPVELKEGDRLLIGQPNSDSNPPRLLKSEIVIIDEIRQLHHRNLYKIKGALKENWNTGEVTAFKVGRNFRHFGHNTPIKFQNVVNDTIKLENQLFTRHLGTATGSITTPVLDKTGVTGVRIVEPGLAALDFPLDSEVNDLAAGSGFIIQGLFYRDAGHKKLTLVRTIADVTSVSMTWGAVSGASSLVTMDNSLTTSDGSGYYYVTDIRYLQFHEVLGPMLKLRAGVVESTPDSGKHLYFFGTEDEVRPLENRRLMFEKTGEEPFTANVAAVETPTPSSSQYKLLRRVTLDRDVPYRDFSNEKPTVDVYGNLVEASQGKTEKETVLGNGDNRQKFQTFNLPKAPLTYHNQAGETPPEAPELKIYVNDRLWKRTSTFFGYGPKEEIYIIREDEDGKSWVQFGDGKTGTRLPSGVGNVKAVYRTGIGAYGPLKEETKPQAGGKLERLDKVYMPQSSSGGDQPETGDNAKEAAPGKTQALGRLVSLKDFESEALAIPGVSRAFAAWEVSDKQSAVLMTLLMETGRSAEFEKVRDILNKYNICRGPQRFPVSVIEAKRSYIYIHAEFALDPSFKEDKVKDAVKTALGVSGEEDDGIDGKDGLFGSRVRRFGQDAYASRIEGIINNVDGVIWAKVNALESLEEADDPASLSPLTAPGFNAALPCDDRHILCLYKTHLHLSVAKEEAGRC